MDDKGHLKCPVSLSALSLQQTSHDLLGRARARASQAAGQAEGAAARQALWVLGEAKTQQCLQPARQPPCWPAAPASCGADLGLGGLSGPTFLYVKDGNNNTVVVMRK